MAKRRNLLVVIITLMFVCMFLTGCDGGDHDSAYIDDEAVEEETKKEPELKGEKVKGLVYIETIKIDMGAGYKDMSQIILYDPETYVMFSAFYWGGDLSINEMHNSDGTLRLYDPN